jgi:hypothetical protein
MNKPHSAKKTVVISIMTVLLSFSGSISNYVLCFGSDGHMHIETTFNGFDCGHYLSSPLQADSRSYLAQDIPFATAPCYACTDIPLASLSYLLQQNSYSNNAHPEKKAITVVGLFLPFSFFPCLPHGLQPYRLLNVPLKSHDTLNQILSSCLRI